MGLNERQMKAVHLVKEKGSLILSDLKKVFPKMTAKTLYRDLQVLVEKKIFKKYGEKKGRIYKFE